MVSPAQIEGVLFFTLNSGLKTDFPRYFGASQAFPAQRFADGSQGKMDKSIHKSMP